MRNLLIVSSEHWEHPPCDDVGHLVGVLRNELAFCPEKNLVLAGYHATASEVHREGMAWLVWSAPSGKLVQAFWTGGREAVLAPPSGNDNRSILVTADVGSPPLEGSNPETGEVIWRRDDLKLPSDSSGDLVFGFAAGAPAVGISRRGRFQALVGTGNGKDVPARDFREETTPRPALPPTFTAEIPMAHQIPWWTNLRARKATLEAKTETPTATLAQEIQDWIQSPPPVLGLARFLERTLHPSKAVARQLGRLMTLENLGTSARLLVSDAKTIATELGDVEDDLLCLYATRSSALSREWRISPAGLSDLHHEPPWYAKRVRRLQVLGAHSANDRSTLLTLHKSWCGPRICTVDPTSCVGPEPLAAWLSRQVCDLSMGADIPATEIDFALVGA